VLPPSTGCRKAPDMPRWSSEWYRRTIGMRANRSNICVYLQPGSSRAVIGSMTSLKCRKGLLLWQTGRSAYLVASFPFLDPSTNVFATANSQVRMICVKRVIDSTSKL
jgi:hypothetical protein